MPTRLPHRIAVVGAGPIGSALAGHLILAGNGARTMFGPKLFRPRRRARQQAVPTRGVQ
jgi:ketopantoate reductase